MEIPFAASASRNTVCAKFVGESTPTASVSAGAPAGIVPVINTLVVPSAFAIGSETSSAGFVVAAAVSTCPLNLT